MNQKSSVIQILKSVPRVLTSDILLNEQLVWVRNYADLRADRMAEISEQTASILPFFGAIGLLNNSRRRASWEILSLVQSVCVMIEMQVKHFCWSPRPIDFAPEVQPVIQTPDHSSFPSGHATEAFAIATVLHHLMHGERLRVMEDASPPMPLRVAHRIAVNRTVAGVHFPVDSAAGAMLGTAIGEAFISLALGGPVFQKNFGSEITFSGDFTQKWLMGIGAPDEIGTTEPAPLMSSIYKLALEEWVRDAK